MEHSQLTWEDFSQYEEIPGYGQHVWRRGTTYYFVTEEGGIAVQRVVYELPPDLFQLLESGQRSLGDIHYKLREDAWPSTEEGIRKTRKRIIEEKLTPLIANPTSWDLFTQEELKKRIPLAEQKWIDWKGKLPDNYSNPL
ncbi:hypothetical protein BVE84_09320 [Streptococcus azizii]|uniref:Uncharacterized protein n=1 Tax=Streptococcus azizii TaxID=1579424 RepID=A0AB36JNL5_9STRE|nr:MULTISPECIES: hypothetical protein [Streptococcus]MBF0777073.1 hypothetical protein [Streptococcus sp. 19428wD3_AN2]ONK25978.1 hypothetical protein BVE86_08495 [Streptococcus azizii]ONK26124.1 hypothetical protein BVE85_09045 [Streptococcus azizii]ONK26375.1 hypothetical protein BVE84_09320 [Streptococcus azizii]TFU81640.1 hypothetical protein E4T83_10015 [Streptococcus sp. AN2]